MAIFHTTEWCCVTCGIPLCGIDRFKIPDNQIPFDSSEMENEDCGKPRIYLLFKWKIVLHQMQAGNQISCWYILWVLQVKRFTH